MAMTTFDLVIDGTGASDTLVVTATGTNSGSYSLNGAAAVPFSGIDSLTFNGLGSDDLLTIKNPFEGLLPIPLFHDRAGQTGHALEILDGTAFSTTYTATGPGCGTIASVTSEVQRVVSF